MFKVGVIFYYFGIIELMCMRYGFYRKNFIMKRYVLSRFIFNSIYRWIYYVDMFFEFGNRIGKDVVLVNFYVSYLGDVCLLDFELELVGFSRLSFECVKGCVENYIDKYGNYYVYINNCYYFVNKIFKIMCEFVICFEWCFFNVLKLILIIFK